MSFSVKYIELFRVQIRHHFFLDKGNQDFNSMSENDQKKQLQSYSFQDFIKIVPTFETHQKLDGHRMVFHPQKAGFSVWVSVEKNEPETPVVELSDNLSITFLLKITDRNFLNYTDLKLSNVDKIYFFSNHRLSSEANSFPLIPLKNDLTTVDESFTLSDESADDEFKKLSTVETGNLFGILRLQMKGENNTHDITAPQGKIKNTTPVFNIEFKNRATTWRYIFTDDQNVKNNDDVEVENGSAKILVTKSEQPLTNTGFITVELDGNELPNPDSRLVKPDESINKIYSEIYM